MSRPRRCYGDYGPKTSKGTFTRGKPTLRWLGDEHDIDINQCACCKKAFVPFDLETSRGPTYSPKNVKYDKYGCMIPNWDEKLYPLGRASREIHHVDGDEKNTYYKNNKVYCPNCHSMTREHKGRLGY